MPKPRTFPTLYDELKTVSISFLAKHGYLKPNQWKGGSINWSRNGNNTGSISIKVCTQPENSFIELDYNCNKSPINYRVQLILTPSNLGKGVVWYFVCPYTGKRCRKLYLADTYFYHRSAFRGCMYEKQTYSKKNRLYFRQLQILFDEENDLCKSNKKHNKTFYKGKPTKRLLKTMKKYNKIKGFLNNGLFK